MSLATTAKSSLRATASSVAPISTRSMSRPATRSRRTLATSANCPSKWSNLAHHSRNNCPGGALMTTIDREQSLADSAANSAIQALIEQQVADGRQIGVQVCVYKEGVPVIDAWAGSMGPDD